MKRLWLLFAQTVTLLLAAYFVVATLKPQWLVRGKSAPTVSIMQAPPAPVGQEAPGSFSAAVRKAAPAVVSISTTARTPLGNDPWSRFFFGDQAQAQTGLGSGVIMSADGYVLTNNHVIENADAIEVMLPTARRAPARLIGTDPESDLAVLKIDLHQLPAITLGDSDALQVGDRVLAIGNPFGVGQTVTSGIVSALGRDQLGINTFENFIQTDAAINPGNSGGALIDVRGNLMGINTAIYSRSGGSMGIGFAIPASVARQVMKSIITQGRVVRGWIGVEPAELTPELAHAFGIAPGQPGVLITGVLRNGPAAQADLRPGDVITRLGGKAVASVAGLLSGVSALPPGQPAPLTVLRQGQSVELSVTPAQRPSVQRRQLQGRE
ncbi:MAG: trypsin-like peptidase domain-containing protein [Burkholderiaceae bacterium]|nr:trypsin-like peptidase domain-containing protein [Burkholderiaceae bacterium]